MRASIIALPVFALIALVSLSATGHARTWNVPTDALTIQAGVDSASAGDTVLVKCGTYYENIVVDTTMTLLSETGEPDCVTIEGQNLGRVVEFASPGGGGVLEGFTITGGVADYGAGIALFGETARVTKCVITDNQAMSMGGGIFYDVSGISYFTDCILAGNSASFAGAFASYNGGVYLESCTFYGNDALDTGNLYAYGSHDTLTSCIFSYATGPSEHITCDYGMITLLCSDVYGNEHGDYVGCISEWADTLGNFSADPVFCYPDGGDFHLHWTSPCINAPGCGPVGALGLGCVARTWYVSTTGSDSTGDGTAGNPFATIQYGLERALWGDTVEVACGTYFEHDIVLKSGVLLTSATGTWDCVTVDAERISRTFEGSSLDSTTTVIGFTVKQGAGVDSGAGMYLDYADLAVTNCKFDSCRAAMTGGGIHAQNSAPTFVNCFFYADSATTGGAMYLDNSTPTPTDCIFTENYAEYYGGAVCLSACTSFDFSVCSAELNTSHYGGAVFTTASTGTIDHCGFRANGAGLNGGAVYAQSASNVTITNSLVYDNVAVSDGAGVICSLSQVDITATTFCGNTAGTGGGCVKGNGATLNLDNTIIAVGGGGGAVACVGGTATLTCCDVFGNVGGDWVGCIAGQDTADNISADPLFCNAGLKDFHLAPYSPCLTGPCRQIGALGVGVDCYDEPPMIVSVTDVGNDQGRQARLKWRRTIYDVPGNEMDITGYTIFRRQDAHLARPAVPEEAVAVDTGAEASADTRGDVPVLKAEGWDQIDYVLAYGDSVYQAVVPTLCDSTDEGICWSVFMVRATSTDPFTYFDSDPDSGYSIDNLAPAPPPGLIMTSETELVWQEVPDEDFDYYSVYGSAVTELDETAILIGYTIDTMQDITGHVYDYYHVTATDFSGNEGEESSVNNVFAGIPEIGDIPTAFALRQNRPNPFSTTTVVAFDLPEETNPRITIYDTHGRLIKRLTDRNYDAGRHAVTWHGQDEAGNQVGPGVYFIRMEAGEFEDMKKIMLLR